MPLALRLLAVVPLALAAPLSAQTWQQVLPLQEQKAFTIESGGVAAIVIPPPPVPDDRDLSDEEFEANYKDATIVVQFPGLAPFAVPADPLLSTVYGVSVGVGRLAPEDPAPSVLVGGYSGGMHCCATLRIVSLVDGRPVTASLPPKDGEPLDAFPVDLDGDVVRDFDWTDDSLLYAFTSYAASQPVPRIFNLRRGELVDVSREPRFAPRFRAFADEALAGCREREPENAGSCAAYAYAMALQGKAEEGIRTAAALAEEPTWYPIDCTVELVEDRCPEGKERTFAGFEDALRWMMRRHGYLP